MQFYSFTSIVISIILVFLVLWYILIGCMLLLFFTILLVLIIIYIIPLIIYGTFSAVFGLKIPQDTSVSRFLFSVLVSKIGTAITFVLLFFLARNIFDTQWLLYAGIWWILFVFGEVGQTIVPNYSKKEAIAGIISETIYLPLSAFVITLLL